MGRSPCCDKVGLKKGPWTPEEDQKLLAYIEEHGHGSWRALPIRAGLQRCGKSCRLRWTNYLRPDIKRGKFSLQEEQTIIQLHALLGNRWSAIATHLAKRTDNEIKNYWNTHLKKKLAKMGIDPITHKPKNDALLSSTNDTQSKNASNLSHMAQWESARLEAEARLVRESKLRSHKTLFQQYLPNFPSSSSWPNIASSSKPTDQGITSKLISDLESPTSTLTTFSDNNNNNNNAPTVINTTTNMGGENSIMPIFEFVGSSASNNSENDITKEEGKNGWKSSNDDHYKLEAMENSLSFSTSGNFHDMSISMEGSVMAEEGFTSLLLNGSDDQSLSDGGGGGTDSDNGGSNYYEDNKNYWNSILNLVNSSPSDSPMF